MMSNLNSKAQATAARNTALDAADAAVGALARRVRPHLDGAARELPHDISERLRFARERATAVHRQVHGAAARPQTAAVVVSSGREAVAGMPSLWWRLVSVLPLAILGAGLVLIQQHHEHEQISVAAEIDSALLADELPPAAYSDPGFSEFLREGGND